MLLIGYSTKSKYKYTVEMAVLTAVLGYRNAILQYDILSSCNHTAHFEVHKHMNAQGTGLHVVVLMQRTFCTAMFAGRVQFNCVVMPKLQYRQVNFYYLIVFM